MMPAWYQRMNPRERVLSWIVAGTVVVLLNLWILSSLWGAVASAQKEFGARRSKLAEQTVYVKERDTWTKRDEWMRQHQPVLKDPAEASALLDQVREVAGKYNILRLKIPRSEQARPRRIIRRCSLRSKPKVRGRPWSIFFTTCNGRRRSWFSKMLISRLTATIPQ